MRLLLALLPFCFISIADAEEATKTLSLKEAQAIALKQHPEIMSSDYRTQAAGQAVKAARSAYYPQANANAVRAFADDGTRLAAAGGINNPTVFDRGSYGVGVSQLITDFGRTNHQVDAAKALAEAQAAKSLSARDQVLFDVTSAYYNVLRAQKVLHVAQVTSKTRKMLMEQVGSLRDAKMKSNLDLSIASQSVSEANLLLLRAENDLDNAQAQLAQTLGYATSQHFILLDDTKAAPPTGNLESLLKQAKDQNPELRALQAQLRASHKQVEAEEAANYPTVSAVGYAGENPLRNDSQLDSHYAAAGVTISIPLFTGGKLSATEKHAEYEAKATEQDMLDKQNQLARDVRTGWNNVQTAYKNIAVSEELRKTSNEALELTQARYELGKSSIVDLSQAQLSQTQAEIAYSNATYEYLIQSALLDFRTGHSSNTEDNIVHVD